MKLGNERIIRIFLRHSLPSIIVVCLLGGGAMMLSYNFIRSNAIEQTNQTLNQVESFYDVILTEIDSLSLMLVSNPEMMMRLRQIISTHKGMDLDSYRDTKLIRSFIAAPPSARSYIHSIYIYLDNPNQIVLSSEQGFTYIDDLYDKSWFRSFKEIPYSDQIFSLRTRGPGSQDLIRIISPISNMDSQISGAIILDIKESFLSRAYEFKSGEVLNVYNRTGDFLFSNDSNSRKADRKDLMSFTTSSEQYGWQYSLDIYKPELYSLSHTLLIVTGILTLVTLMMGLVLTYRTNRRERVFISNIMDQLNQVSDRGLSPEAPQGYTNIFDYLNHHVIRTFIEQDYLRWQKEAMEYRALQMQMNPHFLFNTLDTINWKAVKLSRGENDVSRMILQLTKLLKYSLQVDDFKGVPLSKELEMTQCYLALQKIRFRDRFRYSEEVDPGLLETRVPSFLLQPLLENAFNHGFAENKSLDIRLKVTRAPEGVEITLFNTGREMSHEELKIVNESDMDVLNRKSSLGILNTKKRLVLMTKTEHPLVVSTIEGKGVSVCITLPALGEDDGKAG